MARNIAHRPGIELHRRLARRHRTPQLETATRFTLAGRDRSANLARHVTSLKAHVDLVQPLAGPGVTHVDRNLHPPMHRKPDHRFHALAFDTGAYRDSHPLPGPTAIGHARRDFVHRAVLRGLKWMPIDLEHPLAHHALRLGLEDGPRSVDQPISNRHIGGARRQHRCRNHQRE